ncbi:MAG: hypothetical protein Q9168_003333 [Polycauliona sp. 1 TL-2023]
MSIQARGTPPPFSWQASEYWESDQLWSSFALRVGTPAQIVRVLISSASQSSVRGGLYDVHKSKTWTEQGNYSLSVGNSLSPPDDATFGLDSLALGFTNDTGGPTLDDQVVAALSGPQYAVGLFGLGQQSTNFTNLEDPHPGYLRSLYNQGLIPSLTWSYTAGAHYRLKGVFGSLALGGYDAARFIPNNVTFEFAPDQTRDLVVGLRSIVSSESNGSSQLLLPSAHLTLIDSTIPYLYLPLDVCESFERAFGLIWNSTWELYLVDDELHQTLQTRSPSFTFEIGNSKVGGPTLEINLPYSSFDLTFKPYSDAASIRYFPIQRATNASQYTLGRAFLQEAYLTTDYERAEFSVSQCLFEDPGVQKLVLIYPANLNTSAGPTLGSKEPTGKDSGLGRREIIGIIFGALIGVVIILALCFGAFFLRRRVKRRRHRVQDTVIQKCTSQEDRGSPRSNEESIRGPVEMDFSGDLDIPGHGPMAEMGNNVRGPVTKELADNTKTELAAPMSVFELSSPASHQASR